MSYVWQEFPKAMYLDGEPVGTANDQDEQAAMIAEGYELPPAEREANDQDEQAPAKRGRKPKAKE